MGAKPLLITYNERDGFIKIQNGVRYLVLYLEESELINIVLYL